MKAYTVRPLVKIKLSETSYEGSNSGMESVIQSGPVGTIDEDGSVGSGTRKGSSDSHIGLYEKRQTVTSQNNSAILRHDGFSDRTALRDTICRVSLIAGAYMIATSALSFLAGFYCPIYGLGPVEMAVLNALSVIFFVAVMLPFSLLSSWCLRYNQVSPVQERIFDLNVAAEEAFELSMAAMESLPGSHLFNIDTTNGIINYLRSGTRKFGTQEISIKVERLSAEVTRLNVTSHPKLGAIHYMLFGYTLAVDGSQNKRNVDEIVTFLSTCSN